MLLLFSSWQFFRFQTDRGFQWRLQRSHQRFKVVRAHLRTLNESSWRMDWILISIASSGCLVAPISRIDWLKQVSRFYIKTGLAQWLFPFLWFLFDPYHRRFLELGPFLLTPLALDFCILFDLWFFAQVENSAKMFELMFVVIGNLVQLLRHLLTLVKFFELDLSGLLKLQHVEFLSYLLGLVVFITAQIL